MQAVSVLMAMFSVLVPARLWFPPSQPLTVQVKSDQALQLILTGFDGKRVDPKGSIDVPTGGNPSIDIREMYPAVANAGTYVLFAVPKGGAPADFIGTPVVIESLADHRAGAPPGPMVIRMEPLRYAVMTTDGGPVTMAFYYDVAPNTVDSFLRLATQGY